MTLYELEFQSKLVLKRQTQLTGSGKTDNIILLFVSLPTH